MPNYSQEKIARPVVLEKKKLKEHKRQQEVEKREQKEKLKKENEYRKKFKVSFCAEKLYYVLVGMYKCTLLIFVAIK